MRIKKPLSYPTGIVLKGRVLTSMVLMLALSACSHFPGQLDANKHEQADYKRDSLHAYVTTLAQQLFLSTKQLQFNETIAVGSFLPIDNLEGKALPPTSTLGQQIQESLITLATQSGLKVVEFKTTNTLKLAPKLDIMLSRDLKDINKNINIDYFLTGTYAFGHSGLAINARLIDVSTSNVVAAATDIIPSYVAHGLSGQTVQPEASLSHQLYHLK